jgi:hypothetical protein
MGLLLHNCGLEMHSCILSGATLVCTAHSAAHSLLRESELRTDKQNVCDDPFDCTCNRCPLGARYVTQRWTCFIVLPLSERQTTQAIPDNDAKWTSHGASLANLKLFNVWMQIPERLQFTPELNTALLTLETHWCGCQPGVYRGFALGGKPEGRGEWIADNGHMYVGDWHGGLRHGYGKETAKSGQTYLGDFREGKWDDRGSGVLRSSSGALLWSIGGGCSP